MLLEEFVGLTRNMFPLVAADTVDIRLDSENRLEVEPLGVVNTLLYLTLVGYRVAEVRNARTSPLTLNLCLLLCRNWQNEAQHCDNNRYLSHTSSS